MTGDVTLRCPRCEPVERGAAYRAHRGQRPALSEFERGGQQLAQCEFCGGVWLEQGQLEKVRDASARSDVSAALRSIARLRRERRRQESEPDIVCPGCAGEMFSREWRQSHAIIDVCIECQGVWLDQEELEAIEHYP